MEHVWAEFWTYLPPTPSRLTNYPFPLQRGAVQYVSAGEINPIITMQRNQFTANCVSLYGNFSTCESTVRLDIQNTQDFFFYNNLVSRNIGGLSVRAGSSGTATAMRGLLHNNVFEENEKRPTLLLEGRQTTPYQQVMPLSNTKRGNLATRWCMKHD